MTSRNTVQTLAVSLIVGAIVALGIGASVGWVLKRLLDGADEADSALRDIAKSLAGVGAPDTGLNADGVPVHMPFAPDRPPTFSEAPPTMEQIMATNATSDPTDDLYPDPSPADTANRAAMLGDSGYGTTGPRPPWWDWDEPEPPLNGVPSIKPVQG